MSYDFSILPRRAHHGSAKWEAMARKVPDLSPEVVPLSVADMEFVPAPPITKALKDYLDEQPLGYPAPTEEFYDACTGWQSRRHGWEPDKTSLVNTPGVVPAIYTAVRTLTEPRDGVIIQPPVYYPFARAIRDNGRTVVESPLCRELTQDGGLAYSMDFEGLEELVKDPANTMLVLCSPHNPVGRVWSAVELRRLLDICVAHDVIIVADEIHDDLVMPGYKHSALMRVAEGGEYDRLVICTAPSKTFNITGIQSAQIFITDEELRRRFRRGLAEIGTDSLNSLAYVATMAAYTACDEWLDELVAVIWSNYQLLRGMVERYLPDVRIAPLEGTYLAWLDFRAWGMTDRELEDFMEGEASVFAEGGYLFGTGGEGFVRLNLACPREVLESALERLVYATNQRARPCERDDR